MVSSLRKSESYIFHCMVSSLGNKVNNTLAMEMILSENTFCIGSIFFNNTGSTSLVLMLIIILLLPLVPPGPSRYRYWYWYLLVFVPILVLELLLVPELVQVLLLLPELVQVLLLVLDLSLVLVVVLVFAVMLTMILVLVPVLVPVLVLLVVASTGTGIFIGSDSCISINTRTETFTEADYDTISILLVHKLSLVRTREFINTARAYHQKGNGKS